MVKQNKSKNKNKTEGQADKYANLKMQLGFIMLE